jgi:hypothetical protein
MKTEIQGQENDESKSALEKFLVPFIFKIYGLQLKEF